MKIKSLNHVLDVSAALAEILANPELWDEVTLRTKSNAVDYFHDTSDIWVRINDIKNYDPLNPAEFVKNHRSVWYPCVEKLPSVKMLVMDVMAIVRGEELGGVLITKIPPHGTVKPHIDYGWHQEYYEKFAVQIIGDKLQCFYVDDESLSPIDGELYTFDNSHLHWVTNDSDKDRITLIIAIKRS